MRGSPFLRVILLAGALVLLAMPVWQLTRYTAPPPLAKPVATSEDLADYRVILTASHTARLQAMVANQPTVSSASGVENFEAVFSMSAAEPEDIAVFADFVDRARPAALRVKELRPDLIILDCIGYSSAVKSVFARVCGVPVVLPRTVLGRAAAELAGL